MNSIISLFDFLSRIFFTNTFLYDNDNTTYTNFLHNTLISSLDNHNIEYILSVLKTSYSNTILKRTHKQENTLDLILLSVIRYFIKKRDSNNILSLGYQGTPSYNDSVNNGLQFAPDIVNIYPNTTNNIIIYKIEFSILLARIGDFLMDFLLKNFNIYYPLINNCYIQIAGNVNIFKYQEIGRKNRENNKKLSRFIRNKNKNISLPLFSNSVLYYQNRLLPKNHIFNSKPTRNQAKKVIKIIFEVDDKIQVLPFRLKNLVSCFRTILYCHSRCLSLLILKKYCPFPTLDFNTANLEELINYHTPFFKVAAFLIDISNKTFPRSLFGSDYNWNIFCKLIYKFVSLHRNEVINISKLSLKMKLKDISWMLPICAGPTCSELMNKLLFWIFNNFFRNIISSCFYCTDSEMYFSKILFYHRTLWNGMIKQVIFDHLKKSHYEKIPYNLIETRLNFANSQLQELHPYKRLGLAQLRFFPKASKFRPLFNMSSPTLRSQFRPFSYPAINKVLRPFYEITFYEYKRHRQYLGATLIGMDEFFPKYCTFLSNSNNLSSPYIISLDVKQCFDTLNHNLIFSLLKRFYTESDYILQKYAIFFTKMRQIHQKVKTQVLPFDDYPIFEETALSLSKNFHHAVFSDKVLYDIESLNDLYMILSVFLDNFCFRYGNTFYCQKNGIPQGSVFSNLFACILLDEMENSELFPKLKTKYFNNCENESQKILIPDYLLVRHVDDYLFITFSELLAKSFLEIMNNGFPKFGIFLNTKKTQVSFKGLSLTGEKISYIKWCGFLFDTASLEVRNDFSRYLSCSIRHQFTIDFCSMRKESLLLKLKVLLATRCNPYLFSSSINSYSTICINIYQLFVFCFVRLFCIIKECPFFLNQPRILFFSVILASIKYFFKLCSSKCSSINSNYEIHYSKNLSIALAAATWVFHQKKGYPRISELINIIKYFYRDIPIQKFSESNSYFKKMNF